MRARSSLGQFACMTLRHGPVRPESKGQQRTSEISAETGPTALDEAVLAPSATILFTRSLRRLCCGEGVLRADAVAQAPPEPDRPLPAKCHLGGSRPWKCYSTRAISVAALAASPEQIVA